MKGPKWVVCLLMPLLALASETSKQPARRPTKPPKINYSDPRFRQFKPPRRGDSRSPCPALNALANHGFLPRNGRNVNIVQVIVGGFLGLGISPELSAIIFAFGLISSNNPLTFGLDLEDLRKHHFVIEHDCSFSRDDAAVGDNLHFQQELWDVALAKLNSSSVVNPLRFGRAKAARVQDQKLRNSHTEYGPRAWFNGFSEVGLVLSAMGTVPGLAKLEYVREFIENERLPYHLGWRPKPFFTNLATMLGVGAVSILGDDHLLETAARVVVGTPAEILEVFVPKTVDFLPELENIIVGLGFSNKPMKAASSAMRDAYYKKHKIVQRSVGQEMNHSSILEGVLGPRSMAKLMNIVTNLPETSPGNLD